jgi:uncharacterized protein YciI
MMMKMKFPVLFMFPALLLAQAQRPTDIYQLVFLRPSPTRKPMTRAELEPVLSAHMANIRSMADRGVLVSAGPFEDKPTTISGIFVFKVASLDEARRIAAQDPTVTDNRNVVDAYTWRGPSGVGEEYRRLHKENPKEPEGMGVHPFVLLFGVKKGELKGHAEYVESLRRTGKLMASGPIEGADQLSEILIFRRIPDDEARRLVEDDPAVKSGAIRPEFHRWWSAAHVFPE